MALFELLVKHSYLNPDMQAVVEGFCSRWKVTPFQALLETHAFTESALAKALSVICQVSFRSRIVWEESALLLMDQIPFLEAQQKMCLPLSWQRKDNMAIFAFADPTDNKAIDSILGRFPAIEKKIVVAEKSRIVQGIEEFYPFSQQVSFFVSEEARV